MNGSRRDRFRESLNAAIVYGRVPLEDTGLGPSTLAAIRVVADEHPDASAAQIASAYEAFAREHER